MHKEPRRSPWIIRTYAGFGDAQASNKRFRENLAKGQRGLSIAFDLPTQNGFDADDPMARGEVGRTGVAVSHLGDMELLLHQIDLAEINTSMTINATAPWLYALYLALAKKRGVDWNVLRGTTQNDLMKELVARGTYIFNPKISLRLSCDLIAFASEHTPLWNPINCCGYHYMESGAGPVEEIGMAFGNAMLLLDRLQPALAPERFENVVKALSFFINSGLELIPEICKVRAYGQLWGELCAEHYGVRDVKFRAGCQVRSLTLTEQQPENNIVRIAYEALPVLLSAPYRVGALQLPGFREAQALPDEAEQTLSLRTQQILMHETGIADYGDIFAGSAIMGVLTEKMKSEAKALALELRELGYEPSMLKIGRLLTDGLVRLKRDIDSGNRIMVGVNAFMEPIDLVGASKSKAGGNAAAVQRHLTRLRKWRQQRNAAAFEAAIADLKHVALHGGSILPASIRLAEAGGTTGEWTQALVDVLGPRYQAPLGAEGNLELPLQMPRAEKPYRVLIGKCGLDGHVNAVKLLAYACRQAGLEVVFTGIKQTPESIARAALQEDVDAVGVSSLAGAHLHIGRELKKQLKAMGRARLPVLLGGIIPDADKKKLKALGIKNIFTPKNGDLETVIAALISEARRFHEARR